MTPHIDKSEQIAQVNDYSDQLDTLRQQARSLRDEGLLALVNLNIKELTEWGKEITDNEKVLFRRAKHLAWNLGILDECDYPDALYFFKEKPQPRGVNQSNKSLGPYPEWPILGIPSVYPLSKAPDEIDLFNMKNEPAPILFAANYLRTRLGHLPGYIETGTLLCYYRVIRELYNMDNTEWALGGARAGEGSGPSVFVTTECTRAIGYFARLMENTSEFLARVNEIKSYIKHVKSGQRSADPGIPELHANWCRSELTWCLASLKTTIESSRDYVAIVLPSLREADTPEELITAIEGSVHYFVKESERCFRRATTLVSEMRRRDATTFTEWRKNASKPIGAAALKQMPEFDLTESAHRVASGALAGSRQSFKALRKTKDQGELLANAANLFATLADWLRTHLAPAKEYFEKNLHRTLVNYSAESGSTVVQDMAFSALSVGLITKGWERNDCGQALEILSHHIGVDGKFPPGLPFGRTSRGFKFVTNAQMIRAFAQLVQHSAGNLSPDLVERMPSICKSIIGYFRSTSIRNKCGIAWPLEDSLTGQPGCIWKSSLSVLALHRLVLMIDALINHHVKQHFARTSPADLKQSGVPFLHDLMCSDIGYASLDGNDSFDSQRVVMELEGMRAHLLGPGRARKALRSRDALGKLPLGSLILYGPPGTGKTTLIKSLARTSNVDLIQLSSSDLFARGQEHLMGHASEVMKALSFLTSTVILFDEFEMVMSERNEKSPAMLKILTSNMLPRFDTLAQTMKRNGVAYVLATNYVERLDAAAIREGRFERRKFIYYPDAGSRTCRLVSQLRLAMKQLIAAGLIKAPAGGADRRLLEVVARTAKCNVPRLCKSGWFVAPAQVKSTRSAAHQNGGSKLISAETEDKLDPIWKYIIWNEMTEDWRLFTIADESNNRLESQTLDVKTGISLDQRIVKQTDHWDVKLREFVLNDKDFSWEKAISLLTTTTIT